MRVEIQGQSIDLGAAPGVFMPSPNGRFYGASLRIEPGERVIDIGTGSGMLGIFAALRGGTVCATDIDPAAVTLAGENARRNGVTLDARVGALFADFEGAFDVVIANLPNEIVPPSYTEEHGVPSQSFAGGDRGNDYILALLGAAPAFMGAGSRLYLPIHSLTDYHATLTVALERFRLELLAFRRLPVKPFVHEYLDYYLDLNARGVVHIIQDAEAWYSLGYVYEARLRA